MIKQIKSEYSWLPLECISQLTRMLLDMWDSDGVLMLWVDYIENGEMLSELGLMSSDGKSIRLQHPAPTVNVLVSSLISYDASSRLKRLLSSNHDCPICLSRLPGTLCIQLSLCNHIACQQCLKNFWGKCIAEGNVTKVGCPNIECMKEARGASMKDAKAILSPEQIMRWKRLLQKQEMEKDPSITYCPNGPCQRPVNPPPASPDGPEWDLLRTCECGFSFCVFCRRVWHGPHTPCPEPPTFVEEYLSYPEDSEGRRTIEKKYGKKIVTSFVENRINMEWKERETMGCPACKVRVQKNRGCNHMTCTRCKHHFCYTCGASLDPLDLYPHFDQKSKPPRPCKLFDPDAEAVETT
ncbi:hypothetical protein M422DRAFT_36815 [Sphaerobolus stellatus SS14]|uniref:RBR-type E3 ubiquitin transferase n=1 Tax=Sphaerobolus stellatus (strain SS14) TaxID=990650 RepID=A0A0C9ULR3_SPHS4|nr:hypothetical protein M422DRAFT_36815 [Sphaerobolus stellatus SS14]